MASLRKRRAKSAPVKLTGLKQLVHEVYNQCLAPNDHRTWGQVDRDLRAGKVPGLAAGTTLEDFLAERMQVLGIAHRAKKKLTVNVSANLIPVPFDVIQWRAIAIAEALERGADANRLVEAHALAMEIVRECDLAAHMAEQGIVSPITNGPAVPRAPKRENRHEPSA